MSWMGRWLWESLSPSQTSHKDAVSENNPEHPFPEALEDDPALLRPPSVTGYDAYLVFDVEATCERGTDFDWPNEIIEFPVCLVRPTRGGTGNELEIVDEYRSYVRPTHNTKLTEFCTDLTGITQDQVDSAPTFPDVMDGLYKFMKGHGLLDVNGNRIKRFTWCSDTPFDMQDFMLKQCHISQIELPEYMKGDFLDVRAAVRMYVQSRKTKNKSRVTSGNIDVQLAVLGMSPFQGRKHSGIDDARNISRILIELGRVGFRRGLKPNTLLRLNKKWPWMNEIPVKKASTSVND